VAARIGGVLGIVDILLWVVVFLIILLPVSPEPFEMAGLVLFVAASALMAVSRA
jgi:hypothetical protein